MVPVMLCILACVASLIRSTLFALQGISDPPHQFPFPSYISHEKNHYKNRTDESYP